LSIHDSGTVAPVPPTLPSHVSFAHAYVADLTRAGIDPDEEKLLSRRVTRFRRRGFRLGRLAASRALSGLGVDPEPVLRGEGREPLWPTGIVGSISHTGEYGVAAVALSETSGGIGIDLENRAETRAVESQILARAELGFLEGLDDPTRSDRVLEIFSAKETIYKAFYPRVRHYFGFDAAVVEHLSAEVLRARFTRLLDDAYPPDRTFQIGCRWTGDLLLTALALPLD
jgi:4'-phosphopantetheinyl transferase EntD